MVPRCALLLLAWTCVSLGIASHDGRYALPSLALVVVAGAIAAAALLAPANSRVLRLPAVAGPVAAALAVGLAPLVWHPRYFAGEAGWWVSQVLLAGAGLVAAATVLPPVAARLAGRRWPLVAALALAAGAGVATVVATSEPRIDVYYLLQGSTEGLLDGENMYRQQWAESREVYRSSGLFDVYPYLPWTSVLLLPAKVLTGDVRYGLVAALTAAAVLAWLLAGGRGPRRAPAGLPAGTRLLAPLLLAVLPLVTYAYGRSWTEPLLIALLTGCVLAVERGRPGIAVVCLALALASKQHVALLLPLAALWPGFGWRRAAAAGGLAAALVLPWVVADPAAFWADAVRQNLDLGFRADALCLPTFFQRVLGWSPGFALTAAGLAFAYWAGWRVRGTTVGFCAGGGLLVLVLDLTNRQSFFNHYTLAMALLVLAVCTWLGDPSQGMGSAVRSAPGGHRWVPKRSSEAGSSSRRG